MRAAQPVPIRLRYPRRISLIVAPLMNRPQGERPVSNGHSALNWSRTLANYSAQYGPWKGPLPNPAGPYPYHLPTMYFIRKK